MQIGVPGQKIHFGPCPNGYKPGLGRGAIGFMTRADIGTNVNPENAASLYSSSANVDRVDQNLPLDQNFDRFFGEQRSLFAGGEYDEEDRKADEIYSSIENVLTTRAKRGLVVVKQAPEKEKKPETGIISQIFSDIKPNLSQVSLEEWMNIPEEFTRHSKISREKFTPLPDKIIESGLKELQKNIEVDPNTINDIGKVRGNYIEMKMENVEKKVTGTKTVDKKNYLTSLNTLLPQNNEWDITDIKKAKLVTKSIIQADPKKPEGWIGAARIEEMDGKLVEARELILQGCQECPHSEDIWLEAARLVKFEDSRDVLISGLQFNSKSVKLWIAASRKENELEKKKKVLQKALEEIPNSTKLWRELIDMAANDDEAKTYLYKAVECLPNKSELWIALSKLETYERAKIVINKANKVLQTDRNIWIHAAKLEESQKTVESLKKVDLIIHKAYSSLVSKGIKITRDEWMNDACESENAGFFETAKAIVKTVLPLNLEPQNYEKIWIDDAETLVKSKNIHCAKAVYETLTNKFPQSNAVWSKVITFEIQHGTEESLENVVKLALERCSDSVELILTIAKFYQSKGNTIKAQDIILRSNSDNPRLILFKAKMEKLNMNYENAAQILQKALDSNPGNEKIIKSLVHLLIQSEKYNDALILCKSTCKNYPVNVNFTLLLCDVYFKLQQYEQARDLLKFTILKCRKDARLWINMIDLEIIQNNIPKARALCEQAKIEIKGNGVLWEKVIEMEIESGNIKGAKLALSQALKECPRNEDVWSKAIYLEDVITKKKKAVEAFNFCNRDDPKLLLQTSLIYWYERKMEKTRNWLEKNITLNPKFGDAWIYYGFFEKNYSKDIIRFDMVKTKLLVTSPKYGQLWKKTAKVKNIALFKVEDIFLEGILVLESVAPDKIFGVFDIYK